MRFSEQLIKEVKEHHQVSDTELIIELLETAEGASRENGTTISREIYRQDEFTVEIANNMLSIQSIWKRGSYENNI